MQEVKTDGLCGINDRKLTDTYADDDIVTSIEVLPKYQRFLSPLGMHVYKENKPKSYVWLLTLRSSSYW